MRITVKAEEFGAVFARFGREALPALREAAHEACMEGVPQAVALTNAAGLVDRGAYKLAWKAERSEEGGRVVNDSPYAGVIELGRRPMAPGPPFAPIREWVARKGIADTPEDIDAVAWAIRDSIHVNGTKPRLIGKAVAGKIGENFRAIVAEYLDEVAR